MSTPLLRFMVTDHKLSQLLESEVVKGIRAPKGYDQDPTACISSFGEGLREAGS